MSSSAVGSHSGAGALSLMSCVRESSPLQDYECETEKIVASKRKFWNPRKWFKKKNKVSDDVIEVNDNIKVSLRSRSTSELSVDEETTRRKSTVSMHQGLSQSHDSVFHSPNSGSDIGLDADRSTSSLSISQPYIDQVQLELSERLRLRRGRDDTSEDDEGLPHSPCNSPTTTDSMLADKSTPKDLPTKSHSTCSDGSLISVGSSEIDDDSYALPRLTFQEKRTPESELELSNSQSAIPLNHSAAHHRVAVRPKRTHGAPRRARIAQISTALPVTPELNEDAIRSLTPDRKLKEARADDLTEINSNCSSLPPIQSETDAKKLNRSKSNADNKILDHQEVPYEEKTDKSFFDRLFPRKSGKKKRTHEEQAPKVVAIDTKPIQAVRSGPASRQRVEPIDIPASPEGHHRQLIKSTAEKVIITDSPPFYVEIESHVKQRHFISSTSPPKSLPPQIQPSDMSPPNYVTDKRTNEETVHCLRLNGRSRDDLRNKVKIAGLSSLQQRVMYMDSEAEEGCKSLTDLPLETKPFKPITKSYSFKMYNPDLPTKIPLSVKDKEKIKAASLESMKNFDTLEFAPDIQIDLKPRKTKTQQSESKNDVTISGPSHTAIVNVSSATEESAVKSTIIGISEEKSNVTASVTKIQMKHEPVALKSPPAATYVPEFLSKQLNKVEVAPASNVVFATANSPRIIEEQCRPKPAVEQIVSPRKFSQDNLEIIEKTAASDGEEVLEENSPTHTRFKKNEKSFIRKTSVVAINTEVNKTTQFLKSRSMSLDSLKNETKDLIINTETIKPLDGVDSGKKEKSSIVEGPVVLRRKSLVRQNKKDEEPELLKVFARRSLKLKDIEGEEIDVTAQENKTQDKENQENNIIKTEEKRPKSEGTKQQRKAFNKIEEPIAVMKSQSETKIIELTQNFSKESIVIESDVVEMKQTAVKNNVVAHQRPKSVNPTKTLVAKIEQNKTETNDKNSDVVQRKLSQETIITSEIICEDFATKPKNFNQRKAEWEKRAQEGQRKNVP